MTVRELTEALSLTPFHLAQPDRPVSRAATPETC